MTDRVLVCYGTRYGSAGEIAGRISEVLGKKGATVDVVDIKTTKVKELSEYSLVVVGSGIRADRWTKEPKQFLEKNKDALSKTPVALYVSCGSANEPEKCDEATEKYLKQVAIEYPEIKFVAMGLFGPKYDSTQGNFLMRKIIRGLIADLSDDPENAPEILDFRDWKAIEEWADSLI